MCDYPTDIYAGLRGSTPHTLLKLFNLPGSKAMGAAVRTKAEEGLANIAGDGVVVLAGAGVRPVQGKDVEGVAGLRVRGTGTDVGGTVVVGAVVGAVAGDCVATV